MKKQIISLSVAVLFLCGCKTAKDNSAYNRVISDSSLSNRVYKTLEVSHHCVNDSVSKLFTGISDTTSDTSFQNSPLYHTLENGIYSDSTNKIYTTKNSYGKRYYQSMSQTMLVIKRIHSVDTLKTVVIDTRQTNELNSQISTLNGVNSQLNTDCKSWEKKSEFWFWMFIGSVTLSSAIFVIKLIIKSAKL